MKILNIIFCILIVFLFIGTGCQSDEEIKEEDLEKEKAIEEAYKIFNQRVSKGVDMRNGRAFLKKLKLTHPYPSGG